jgi:hypothetical protein
MALAEDARFRLRIKADPAGSLDRARDLWAIRRELADARLVLEAAREARVTALARNVVDWMQTNRVEDARLRPLMQKAQETVEK